MNYINMLKTLDLFKDKFSDIYYWINPDTLLSFNMVIKPLLVLITFIVLRTILWIVINHRQPIDLTSINQRLDKLEKYNKKYKPIIKRKDITLINDSLDTLFVDLEKLREVTDSRFHNVQRNFSLLESRLLDFTQSDFLEFVDETINEIEDITNTIQHLKNAIFIPDEESAEESIE